MKNALVALILLVLKGIVYSAGRVLFRFHVKGADRVPSSGGCFVVFNHASYLDFIIAACTVPGKVSFIMNAAVYHKRGLHWLFRAAGCIPVGSSLTREGRDAFNRAVSERIAEGRVVCIFAEGTVTRTGHLLSFRRGIEHLVRETGAPVIPAHIHNVVGAPFSWLPSGGRLVHFSWRKLRRPVWVSFGHAMHHPVDAFHLRQEVRNLEAEHFANRFGMQDTLSLWLGRKMRRSGRGFWAVGNERIAFSELAHILPRISATLDGALDEDKAVAVLLPASPQAFAVWVYLMSAGKVIIPLDPNWTNEERLYVCNSCGVKTVITIRDLRYTHWAPVTSRTVFMEDLWDAMRRGRSTGCLISAWRRSGLRMMQNFRGEHRSLDTAMIFHDYNTEGELTPVVLSNRNLLCAVQSIGQSYFFDGTTALCADLQLNQPASVVLQVLVPVMFDVGWFQLGDTCSHSPERTFCFLSPDQLHALDPSSLNASSSVVFTTWPLQPQDVERWRKVGHVVHACGNHPSASGIFSVNLNNFRGVDIEGKDFEQESSDDASSGKPLPGLAAAIGNEQGPYDLFRPGDLGILWLRGSAVVSAQGVAPGEIAWVNTGIRACITESGFIRPADDNNIGPDQAGSLNQVEVRV